jgi:hypothetical protein
VVGHTHEDVDAVLSLVKRALDAEQVLLTPRDMMRAIERKLRPLFEQQDMLLKTFWVEQVPFLKPKYVVLLMWASKVACWIPWASFQNCFAINM